MNEIDTFTNEGIRSSETVIGDPFEWSGKECFGIFNEIEETLDQREEGYYIDVDMEIVARREQFGSSEPEKGDRIEVGGKSYVIRDRHLDNVHVTLSLKERRTP